MAKDTLASLRAEIDRLSALVAAPAQPSEASAHFKARDIACPAAKPCAKTFRTAKGAAWHVANVKH